VAVVFAGISALAAYCCNESKQTVQTSNVIMICLVARSLCLATVVVLTNIIIITNKNILYMVSILGQHHLKLVEVQLCWSFLI